MSDLPERPVLWVASAKRDLLDMPKEVVSDFGYGLYEAQMRQK
jgi:phage-related protein